MDFFRGNESKKQGWQIILAIKQKVLKVNKRKAKRRKTKTFENLQTNISCYLYWQKAANETHDFRGGLQLYNTDRWVQVLGCLRVTHRLKVSDYRKAMINIL